MLFCCIDHPNGIKVVDTVSVAVPIWPLEWYISVPVNIGVSFRVYRYIYIFTYLYVYSSKSIIC
jgi:hypothetical protein